MKKANYPYFSNKKAIIPIFFVSILWFLYGGQRWKIVATQQSFTRNELCVKIVLYCFCSLARTTDKAAFLQDASYTAKQHLK